MDPKEKNQQVSQKQKEQLDKRNTQEQQVEDITNATPIQLRSMLSNRNSEYLFRLEKLLKENGLSEEEAKTKVNEFLPEMVIEQRKGRPASQLYGTPQDKINKIINPKQKSSDVVFWKRALDNSLLYLAIFAGMFGLVSFFSKEQQPIGVVTILSVGILFGTLMTYYNDLILRKKEDRPAMWKMLLGGFGIVIFIFLWITLTEMPFMRAANPVFPGWVVLVIAVIAFVYRKIFRAHNHIIDSPFTSGQQRNKR